MATERLSAGGSTVCRHVISILLDLLIKIDEFSLSKLNYAGLTERTFARLAFWFLSEQTRNPDLVELEKPTQENPVPRAGEILAVQGFRMFLSLF